MRLGKSQPKTMGKFCQLEVVLGLGGLTSRRRQCDGRAKASDSCKNFDGEEHRKDLRDAGGGAVMVNHGGICL